MKTDDTSDTRASIILNQQRYLIPFLYLLHKFVSRTVKIIDLDRKAIPMHAIPPICNCFLFRNYSAIACNEKAQTEATIARNGIPIGNPSFETITGSYINVNFQAFIHTFITNQKF